ncbi:MAG: 1-acyl-sn-glycerol-3-phosphate acyltransferase [Candidatus Heimdallarchaeota archaeon]|nr:1-acyl-sn-glycerol-3-phosphate acyltransferase [Candidatus Heimdallarchaeota archaeon]
MRIPLPQENMVSTKNSMFSTPGIEGPADFFNYSYATNHFWFKIAGPILVLAQKVFRVKIEGLENIPRNTNFVIMPNHVSHADSFFAISHLWRLVNNFHFIADEKLFKNKWFRILASMFNVFPVRKGAKSTKIVEYAIARVNNGDNLLWYPEGQRHKNPSDNKCNTGKLGSGMLAHRAEVPIIPVFLYGPEFVMPVGRGVTYGKKIRSLDILIRYGKPIYLEDLRALPSGKETSEKVVKRIIDAIEEMRPKGPYLDQSDKL